MKINNQMCVVYAACFFANYSNRICHEANVHGLKAPKKTDSEQDDSDNKSSVPSSEEQSESEHEED